METVPSWPLRSSESQQSDLKVWQWPTDASVPLAAVVGQCSGRTELTLGFLPFWETGSLVFQSLLVFCWCHSAIVSHSFVWTSIMDTFVPLSIGPSAPLVKPSALLAAETCWGNWCFNRCLVEASGNLEWVQRAAIILDDRPGGVALYASTWPFALVFDQWFGQLQ